MSEKSDYRFSFGPWNIHEGADPFGASKLVDRSVNTRCPKAPTGNPRLHSNSGTLLNFTQSHMV